MRRAGCRIAQQGGMADTGARQPHDDRVAFCIVTDRTHQLDPGPGRHGRARDRDTGPGGYWRRYVVSERKLGHQRAAKNNDHPRCSVAVRTRRGK